MYAGKKLRWRRFCASGSGHSLLVPIDHGLTLGPLLGIENVAAIGRWVSHPSITGIVAHKGIIERLAARELLGASGVMVHLNGMSSLAPTPDRKEMVTEIETAIRLGADGVSVQVNFDGAADAHNLMLLGRVVDAAQTYGLPVLTMLYDKVASPDALGTRRRLRQWMRAAVELGTDAIKIGAPRARSELVPLLEGISDDVAIVVAGGELGSDVDTIALAVAARAAGAAGICIGRNVFCRPSPGDVLGRLHVAMAPSAGDAPRLAATTARHAADWSAHGAAE
jgi:class I fructose-bisphosphate aldolase/fructose-bisphosphate aldolase/2-amino-3,7-dideoxy-D-threo-hept-6-ulosonate synthase